MLEEMNLPRLCTAPSRYSRTKVSRLERSGNHQRHRRLRSPRPWRFSQIKLASSIGPESSLSLQEAHPSMQASMYACSSTHTDIHTYTHTHTHAGEVISPPPHVRSQSSAPKAIRERTQSRIHTYIHTYIHSFIHSYIHRYIHRYIHSYTPWISKQQAMNPRVEPIYGVEAKKRTEGRFNSRATILRCLRYSLPFIDRSACGNAVPPQASS